MGTEATRRSLLAAAAAAGLGAVLAGCGRRGPGPAPAPAAPRLRLLLQPSGALPWSSALRALYREALEPFEAANPGVEVVVRPGTPGATPAAILAGTAADVIADHYPPPYFSTTTPLLRPLDGYLARDGIPATAFAGGQVAAFRALAPGQQLCMLPSHCAPVAFVVRQGDVAAAGLEAPGPGWTAADFTRLCAGLAAWRGPAARGGAPPAVLAWDSALLGAGTWALQAWGGALLDGAGQPSLSATPDLAAGRWLYEGLFWPGYAGTWDRWGPRYGGTEVTSGRVSVQLAWGGLVLDQARRFTGFPWDYVAPPAFPQGPTGPVNADFYAIPVSSAHPEQAWALLRFLAADPGPAAWPAAMIRAALLQPALLALWPSWLSRARATAPALRGKDLEVFQEMAASGRAVPPQYWPRDDASCRALTAGPLADLWSRAATVPEAFAAIDRQVGALLAEAAAAARAGSPPAAQGGEYPAPPQDGAGLPATPAGELVVPPAGGGPGTWRLLGDGQAIGGTADTAVFAAAAATAAAGSWTCRLVSLSAVPGPAGGGAAGTSAALRVGLMARADLSDDAAFVAVFVAGDGRLVWANRPSPTLSPLEEAAGVAPSTPLWLRLERQGATWTGSTSTDGRTFRPLGPPQPCPGLGGAWIGPVACSGSGYVATAFDGLSFTPTAPVQLGVLGVPPGAGPVPAGWPAG